MALYKDPNFVKTSTSDAFDKVHSPGTKAPHAGIYRCTGCGHEIGIAHEHTLPPQTHHQHASNVGKIAWQLIVYAVSP